MTTLKDVAEKVGVSVTTVSRVLNGRGAISEKTKARVYKVMKELNYSPNEMARSLSGKNSHLIGLIVPYIGHPFFSTLTDAIEESCYQTGYKLLLCSSNGHPDRERELFSMFRANNVAGVLVCTRLEDASTYVGAEIPLVSIERTIDDVPSVSCDNYKGGILAARELTDSGCKHALLFGNRVFDYLPAHLRYQGFMDECEKGGLDYVAYYIEPENVFGTDLTQRVLSLLDEHPEIDGIFATGDVLAARVMNILRENRKRSEHIRIIGFDGIDISEYLNISTIAQPIRQMGALAVEVLAKRIDKALVPERSILPTTLIRRNSTRLRR